MSKNVSCSNLVINTTQYTVAINAKRRPSRRGRQINECRIEKAVIKTGGAIICTYERVSSTTYWFVVCERN